MSHPKTWYLVVDGSRQMSRLCDRGYEPVQTETKIPGVVLLHWRRGA